MLGSAGSFVAVVVGLDRRRKVEERVLLRCRMG